MIIPLTTIASPPMNQYYVHSNLSKTVLRAQTLLRRIAAVIHIAALLSVSATPRSFVYIIHKLIGEANLFWVNPFDI